MVVRISTILEALTTTILLHSLYGKKYYPDFKTILFLAIDFVIFQGINECYLPKGISAVIYFIIAAYCMWEFKSSVKEMIINFILYVVLLGSMQVVFMAGVYYILPNIGAEVQVMYVNFLILAVCAAFNRKQEFRKISYFFQQRDVIIRVILIMSVTIIISCMYLVKYREGLYLGEYVAVCILITVLCIMAASWEAYKLKAYEKEAELRMYQLYEESFENLLLEIRMRQHEFNNHISAVFSQHLTCSTYEELVDRQKKYCGQIMSENRYEKLLVSGNTILTGFLYGKFVEAEKRDINISYNIDSTNLNIRMPDYKVVELAGNLLNNAMEALEKTEKKKLHIGIGISEDETVIEVRNTGEKLEEEEIARIFTKGYSEKGNNRGLGLYSIKKLSKEYGFKIICENQDIKNENWITFRLMFKSSPSE